LMDMISPRAFLLTNEKNVWYGLSTSLRAFSERIRSYVQDVILETRSGNQVLTFCYSIPTDLWPNE
jgi:hypothetical protein